MMRIFCSIDCSPIPWTNLSEAVDGGSAASCPSLPGATGRVYSRDLCLPQQMHRSRDYTRPVAPACERDANADQELRSLRRHIDVFHLGLRERFDLAAGAAIVLADRFANEPLHCVH